MNKNLKSRLAFSILVLTGIQVSGQSSYPLSVLNNPTRLAMASFSAMRKQSVDTHMVGNELHRKENGRWPQVANLEFYSDHFATTNSGSLAGGRMFFYNPLPVPPNGPDYQYSSSKTRRSEFPNLYGVSGIASFNQNTRTKLNIWLPKKTETRRSHQVMGALIYTALTVYSTRNQQIANNPIMNPNFPIIKP